MLQGYVGFPLDLFFNNKTDLPFLHQGMRNHLKRDGEVNERSRCNVHQSAPRSTKKFTTKICRFWWEKCEKS